MDDLTVPPGAAAEFHAILRADPEESLQRQLSLIDMVLLYLEGSR